MRPEDLDKQVRTNSHLADPMAEVQQTENVEVESTSSTTTRPTITTATSPVERKKMTGNTGGRRKLTPHPLNPNNASTAVGSQVYYNAVVPELGGAGGATGPPNIWQIS